MDVKGLKNEFETHLSDWREQEKDALKLLKIVGDLRFDRSVELILFRRNIYNARSTEILNDHLYAKNYVNKPITIKTSLAIAETIAKMKDFAPARIDIGKLAAKWLDREEKQDLEIFVKAELKGFVGATALEHKVIQPKDVVIYGFGRIGRLAVRELTVMMGRGEQLCLRAIVVRPKQKGKAIEDLQKRASLLRKDSIHGKLWGIVQVQQEDKSFYLVVNSCKIEVIFAAFPEDIDYTKHGINHGMVIDTTGAWRNRKDLSRHLRPGIKQILFTAPGDGIKNIVYGINQGDLNFAQDTIFCAASCTTNAIAPVLKVVHDKLGILNGHVESVHAYTSSQNLLDNYHKKERRGRAATLNMVITSTGAATAVSKVIPSLEGKLTGSAIRVPVPNGSLAIMTLNIEEATDINSLNALMHQAALFGDLVEQIQYSTSKELVSSDIIGSPASSIFDAPATKVSKNGKTITVYVWYDNEYGYTRQVLRLAKYAAQVRRYRYY